jgi:hypothetical protein
MGMGFGASYADVIEWSQIKRIVPKEARALARELKRAGVSMDNFCQAMDREHWDYAEIALDDPTAVEKTIRQIESAWACLFAAFMKATAVDGVGLSLAARFHNADNDGDRYDDVSGGFFHVDGVYQLTPAGRKFAGKIERKFYVTFG